MSGINSLQCPACLISVFGVTLALLQLLGLSVAVAFEQEAQQASLNGLMQRYHMAEQHRQLQRQQAMQQMGQPSELGSLSSMQGSQHMTGSQAFPQQRMQQMGMCLPMNFIPQV